ncbi:hypothetical protein [Tropicimonas sp.]|uniref:hypothetical protein n=1 Tax=Tropicimonas sp. TaxID=2067044 RepID=UPI003A87084E
MSTWQSDALITGGFVHSAKPATLDIDPRGGMVEIALQDADGIWRTFESFDTLGSFKIEVVNTPPLRISATADAVFRWTWHES